MARARKTKSNSVKVNFKGVESRKTPKEGDYVVEVLEANSGKSSNGNDQIEFILEIAKGEYKGVKLWFYCPLQENSLWKLHAFLTALGEDVPEDEMDIDLSDLVGKQCVGVLTHETYNGKKRAKMTDFDTLENYSGGDDEDEDDDDDDKKSSKKSKSKAGAKGKSKKSSDDEDDDDEPKSKKSKGKKKPADDEDEDDEPKSKKGAKSKKSSKDDDDEDDEPKGKKSSKKDKGKKPKKVSADDVDDMDEDELQELIDKHDLDVDLDDFKKLTKKVQAVKDALEEEDLLEDDD